MNSWREWLNRNHAALVDSSLPGFLYADESLWNHFVSHAFVPQSDVAPSFDVSTLRTDECIALLRLLDTAPELESCLFCELLFNLSKSQSVVLEALITSDDDNLAEEHVHAAARALHPTIEKTFDRLVIDRAARLIVTREPPGIVLQFLSDQMSPPRALMWARRLVSQLRADGSQYELVPLSWPDRFDGEMDSEPE